MSRYAVLSSSRWSRPMVLMAVLVGAEAQLVALAGNDAPAASAAFVDSSFACHAEGTGTRDFPAPGRASSALDLPCFYRLYATQCDAPSTSGDVTRQQCRTDSLMEFALRRGQTRTVARLPAGFRYCVSLQAAPTLEECMRNPAPQ